MKINSDNPYLKQIEIVLPRLLSLFDQNQISNTFGIGDRMFWGWKTIDFANANYQGIMHGLALIVKHNICPLKLDKKLIMKRIVNMINSIHKIIHKNGSLDEAFPYENSFCVTSLIAYDLLSTIEILENDLSEQQIKNAKKISHALIKFIVKNDEKHGFISNHLATAAIALFKYHDLIGYEEANQKGNILLEKVLSNQSTEGWYKEYEGSDPGYQSLCTFYLAEIFNIRPSSKLKESIKKSLKYLCYFVHPDGSFGGIYGSRNTRFYYPSGFENLKQIFEEATAISEYMKVSISNKTVVTLETLDGPNLSAMFNSYCLATIYSNKFSRKKTLLPFQKKKNFTKNFNSAGIFIINNKSNYSIVSYFKGGVCYSFDKNTNKNILINTGVIYQRGKSLYTTQSLQKPKELIFQKNKMIILTPICKFNGIIPSPIKFLILRILNLTILQNYFINEIFKKILVWLLITKKNTIGFYNKRIIKFNNNIEISDNLVPESKQIVRIEKIKKFSNMHMSSQGYWQIQDDLNDT